MSAIERLVGRTITDVVGPVSPYTEPDWEEYLYLSLVLDDGSIVLMNAVGMEAEGIHVSVVDK